MKSYYWHSSDHAELGDGLLGVIQMAYPIGGLIADIRYGRYR